ncbi:MAG: GDYXXLXY domain-containing protein [Victivallaceae bacterium]
MHLNKIKLVLFFIMALVMLAVPLYMIMRAENIFNKGNVFTFKAAPVDPYDPFRGRYVSIRVEPDYVQTAGQVDFKAGDELFATVKTGTDGMAFWADLNRTPPDEGDYVRVKFKYNTEGKSYIQPPFDRFYMNEKLAPEAEKTVRLNSNCTIKVRILNGKAVIENVYIGDVSLRDYVLQNSRQKK